MYGTDECMCASLAPHLNETGDSEQSEAEPHRVPAFLKSE